MKITFYRDGHANNSSSSHSVIFTKTEMENTESTEFGWATFVCSSPQAKINYLMACLRSSFRAYVNLRADNCPYFTWAEVEALVTAKFRLVVSRVVYPLVSRALAELIENSLSILDQISVDHQSLINFPACRNTDDGMNLAFAAAVLEEATKPEYVIIGGNDNDDEPVDVKPRDVKDTPFTTLLNRLTSYESRGMQCVFDPLLEEYLISWDSGPIMKINFQLPTPEPAAQDRLITIGEL